MTRHQKLDNTLKNMSKNIDEMIKRPTLMVQDVKRDIKKSELYMMFKFLLEDGFVY